MTGDRSWWVGGIPRAIIWAILGLQTALWLGLHECTKADAEPGPHTGGQASEIGHVELQATSDNQQTGE